MSRLEKVLCVAILVGIVDIVVHVAVPSRTNARADSLTVVSPAQAQAPIVGVSLLPRYVITTNQSGDVIYVWEDQGKGYMARVYTARP
ncbi:MAG: hypothetical protein N2Z21_04105 [Candidatus Sumerlaeaceae bacterium]|nr:hypothetical protein [Candidatus Sumerlaeaceae bacterium]